MGNRILKESICTSETIDALSPLEETAFYRLLVNCDDFGRMDGRPAVLKARMYPLKDLRLSQLTAVINRLASVGLVTLYEVDGKPFIQIVSWERHQQVRAKRGKFPAPDITCNHMISDDIRCCPNPIQSNPIQYVSESNNNPPISPLGGSSPKARFLKPTVEEIREQCEAKGYSVDPESFHSFYESKGWVVGNSPMKNWKAALVTWEKRRKEDGRIQPGGPGAADAGISGADRWGIRVVEC